MPLKSGYETGIFTVQLHEDQSIHFDLQLEVNGVLKSWAIPKGPSFDPRNKRLAIPIEEHPLQFANFEGTLSEGEYNVRHHIKLYHGRYQNFPEPKANLSSQETDHPSGSHPIILWDKGHYENLTEIAHHHIPLTEALRQKYVVLRFQGQKLRGGFILRAAKGCQSGNWLLIKAEDEKANPDYNPVQASPQSILSGRRLEEIPSGQQ